MKPFSWINRAWVLAIILGLTGASCTTQVTTNSRPPTPDIRPLTSNEASTSKEPDAITKARVQVTYGKLPLHFEPNQGQSDAQVKFLSRGSGYTLFLTPTEAVLILRQTEPKAKASPELSRRGKGQKAKGKREEQEKTDLAKLETQDSKLETVVRMKLVGANPTPQVVGLDELPGKSNYFIDNDPKDWRTNIPTYAGVQYKDIYPGIDLIYYGNQRRLEHDFVIASGADPKAIQLAFEGADSIEIDNEGDLILHLAGGDIRLHQPHVYQEINGIKQAIAGGYVLLDLETRNSELETQQVGFQVAAYDASKPLIIDPVLSYSTYLGGRAADEGLGVAVDTSGNAYVTGFTDSPDFPTTVNAMQPYLNDDDPDDILAAIDVFVVKLDSTGSVLLYSTYLGGNGEGNPTEGYDYGNGIAVDTAGNAYVTGETLSPDFPITMGAFQAANSGGYDAFVTKLDPTGSALVYSTYLGGGRGGDFGYGITIDSSGNAYVTGRTFSTDFPTAGPFQAAYGGGLDDAFVTKLNAAGSALVYSTYLGGREHDSSSGIAVDSSGNAYVTGNTISPNFPTTRGAFDRFCGTDRRRHRNNCFDGFAYYQDAFVTKLDPTGSALVYSTYLGGYSYDYGEGIAVDSSGNAYVIGEALSPDFPTTRGAFQTTYGGPGFFEGDAFVTKLDPAGSALVYSTYLGGIYGDGGRGIALDASGNAYVTGSTTSTNFPTASPLQAAYGGSRDAFVVKLNAAGSALVYSTYLGGSDTDLGYSIALDASGNAYVTGFTFSTDFPTVSPLQAVHGGDIEVFIAKIADTVVDPSRAEIHDTSSSSALASFKCWLGPDCRQPGPASKTVRESFPSYGSSVCLATDIGTATVSSRLFIVAVSMKELLVDVPIPPPLAFGDDMVTLNNLISMFKVQSAPWAFPFLSL